MDYTDRNTIIGIFLSGKAELTCSEFNGKSYLLESYEPHDVFGSIISLTIEIKLYLVSAITNCTVVYIDYYNFIYPCSKNCKYHDEILKFLLMLMSNRLKYLSLRLNILCKSTIREQILTYLEYHQLLEGSNSFTIPISLLKLSQYLCVDRRSLMREIRKLNEEHIIHSSGRKFTLLTYEGEIE